MISLNGKECLAQGANRVCYVHPQDSSKLLKIVKPWKRSQIKRGQSPWYKRLRPAACFDDNIQEYKAFKVLAGKRDYQRHFPQCYGMIETDLGTAICVEYIRSDDQGDKIISMGDYIKKNGFTDEITEALNELCSFLYSGNIITRDLREFNIMVRNRDGKMNLVIVDGLGNSEFLPVSSIFYWFGRRKIKRKLRRFKNRLERKIGDKCWSIPSFN